MNTRRENRLEELGRVDAEKAYTSKGKRNLREEKDRIRSELNRGGQATKPMDPQQRRKQKRKIGVPGSKAPRPFKKKKIERDAENLIEQYKQHKRDKFKRDLDEYKKQKPKPKSPGPNLPRPRTPGDPPRVIDPRAPRPKKDRIMTPLGVKVKYRKGGSVKGPNRPRPQGPHMWVRGEKRKKYSSGGAVMAGKKVGCQIK